MFHGVTSAAPGPFPSHTCRLGVDAAPPFPPRRGPWCPRREAAWTVVRPGLCPRLRAWPLRLWLCDLWPVPHFSGLSFPVYKKETTTLDAVKTVNWGEGHPLGSIQYPHKNGGGERDPLMWSRLNVPQLCRTFSLDQREPGGGERAGSLTCMGGRAGGGDRGGEK